MLALAISVSDNRDNDSAKLKNYIAYNKFKSEN